MAEVTLGTEMARMTLKSALQIAVNKGIEVSQDAIIDKMKATHKEKFAAIMEEVQKDAKEADLFGGLEQGKMHSLVQQVASVSIRHGCVMYAKEIIDEIEKGQ
jgi:hypothetical protein